MYSAIGRVASGAGRFAVTVGVYTVLMGVVLSPAAVVVPVDHVGIVSVVIAVLAGLKGE